MFSLVIIHGISTLVQIMSYTTALWYLVLVLLGYRYSILWLNQTRWTFLPTWFLIIYQNILYNWWCVSKISHQSEMTSRVYFWWTLRWLIILWNISEFDSFYTLTLKALLFLLCESEYYYLFFKKIEF